MNQSHTRRTLLKGISGALGISALAGCTGSPSGDQEPDAVRYVVGFHWGFRMLTPDGTVTDRLELGPDSRLVIHAVNLEPLTEDATLSVPEPVSRTISENYKDWEAASVQRIAPQVGMSVADLETRLDEAESTQPEHTVALMGPDGGHLFNATLGAEATAPKRMTVWLKKSGSYDFTCTGFCGFGHSYMTLPEAIVVS